MNKEELSRLRRENAHKLLLERYNKLEDLKCMFNPGQQVICIDGDFSELLSKNPSINVPQQYKIYIVRDRFNFINNCGITLEEIFNKPIKGSKVEPNFNVKRFALLSEVSSQVLIEEEYLQAA